jgi:hypothetical protein
MAKSDPGSDDAFEGYEEFEEVGEVEEAPVSKRARLQVTSRTTSNRHNQKKKEAALSTFKNVRVLFVVAESECLPVTLFNVDEGLGKQFNEGFQDDVTCRFDYAEMHGMVEMKDDNRDDLKSWLDESCTDAALFRNNVLPFNLFAHPDNDASKHSLPAANHVIGVLFKKFMDLDHADANVSIGFVKENNMKMAILKNRNRFAEFIAKNFDIVYLGDDSPFYPGPKIAGRAFIDIYYEFLACDLSQKWWVSVYPPLKIVQLLANKALRDNAVAAFKLPQVTIRLPLDKTDDDVSEWATIFEMARKGIFAETNVAGGAKFPLAEEHYLNKRGIVGKPLQGCGGLGVVFLSLTDPDNMEVQAKDLDGKPITTVSQLLGGGRPSSCKRGCKKSYTFEPYVPALRNSEVRVIIERVKKGHWIPKYFVTTNFNAHGSIESTFPAPMIDPSLQTFVKDVMKQLEASTEKDWKAFPNLVFRVDVFQVKWVVRNEKNVVTKERKMYRVNEVEIFPLANSFASCGEQHEAIFNYLTETFIEHVKKTILDA